MPIRAQCDNCGKVYNLPDTSAGKRLRCKQCAVAFTVPSLGATGSLSAGEPMAGRNVRSTSTGSGLPVAGAAPTLGPQKVCIVCKQDVSGRPRTKDQAGNYYCRSCYEERARAREQLAQSRVGAAVPAGVGAGGDGGGDGEIIDLGALEPTEQFDESMQPPPPPIPDMDLVAPPLPDMGEPIMAEPVMLEVPPRPKKKKKKKKGAAAAKSASADSIVAKIVALPHEIWVGAVGLMMIIAGLAGSRMAPQAALGLILLGGACALWGHICCVIAAFSEDTTTGVRYLIFPFYQLFFILSNWSTVQRYVMRTGMGIVFIIAGFGIMVKFGKETIDQWAARHSHDKSALTDLSSDSNFKITVDLEDSMEEEEEATINAKEKSIADTILASLKQRGVKPPAGEKYDVEAAVEMTASDTEKITIPINGREMKLPAPMLVCHLLVKDAGGTTLFDQSKNIVTPRDAIATATEQEKKEGFIEKRLWEKVPGEFQALVAQVPTSPAGAITAPAGGSETPKTDASKDAAAPAK